MPQTTRWATAAIAVSTGMPGVATAATVNVPGDFATIQACIDAAVSGVDECVVAPGTYHETIDFFGKAITLRSSGGADVTTIDATGIGGSVVTCASGEGPGTVLDGFTITGGTGATGGGMHNDHSSPSVANCTFTGNVVSGSGGGMYNEYSSPNVTDCTFRANAGGWCGGGMCNYHTGSPVVTGCVFDGNVGSGMQNHDRSSPVVMGCTFTGNLVGMANSDASDATVGNCVFSWNTGGLLGGGMYSEGSNLRVDHCAFRGNAAKSRGGGVFCRLGNLTLTNCSFNGNTAGESGGGLFIEFGGGTSVVRGCEFRGNTAPWGGAVFNFARDTVVGNCTFVGNAAEYGGGMYNYVNSSPTVTDSTFSGNTAAYGGGMYSIYDSRATMTNCVLWGDSALEVVNDEGATSEISFTDVQGGLPVGAIDGGGNIDIDPMFVSPPDPGPDGTWDGVDDDYGDLRLQAGSPCIDAGDPTFATSPGETDLEAHARVLCGRVDMGAYEFGIGDYDCDRSVDLTDFANWSACMIGPSTAETAVPHTPDCEAFDFDADGDVDLVDFDPFQMIFRP